MARYAVFWEYNIDHCPLSSQQKTDQWLTLADSVKKLLKSGEVKEWTHYAGEAAGYMIIEGSETDVLRLTDTYLPYIKCTVKTMLTIEQCEQVWRSLPS